MAQLDYEAGNETLDTYDPIPVGHYEALITESDVMPTKNGQGTYLKLTWTIASSGEHEGRRVFDRVTLTNPNQKAQEIGRKQLNTICQAMGKQRISDSAELHGIVCVIDVRVRAADANYPASNEIKGYKPIDAAIAGAAQAAPTSTVVAQQQHAAPRTAAPTSAPKAAAPPWKR